MNRAQNPSEELIGMVYERASRWGGMGSYSMLVLRLTLFLRKPSLALLFIDRKESINPCC